MVTGQSESIEYSIEIGRFKLGECGKLFGIAAYHHWISAVGNDYGFPSNQWFDQPGTWEPAQLDGLAPCPPTGRGGKIAYVYRGNRADAVSFYNLLVANGYSVDMVPLSIVTATDFSAYDLMIIADDTGDLNTWGSGTKTFKVWVFDTQCHNQRTVVNRAGLIIPGEQPAISNVVSHPVTCPPITFPNDQPPYAEDEIQVNPYPLITGTPSDISVRISNTSASAQAITVSSGHYCIQVKVQGMGFAPIYTQRNLDVTENLQPGQTDTLTFKVRNDSNVTTDILLDVDNTCPGWTATVIPTLLTNMAPGEVRNAQLLVTPPNPVTLGSACHIDVRGWIGDRLIGGIRKLDVPPVHLPTGIDPPWLEPEITVATNPPVVGQPTQLCVQLQNPLGISRIVTLVYAVADFGAGIPFTTVATTVVTLPPNSNANYCITWTPALGGTLHRCVLITLKQNGYQDQTSQHNLNLIRRWPGQLGDYTTTVRVHNPDIISHTLRIDPLISGLDPFWKIHILPDPPPELGPGDDIMLEVGFTPGTTAFATPAATLPVNIGFGDETRIDLAIYLDDEQVGGFTLSLDQSRLYLPLLVH